MIKKYEEYINEKFKVIDYKIILKDIKDNPVTLITDFKVIKVENSKSEIKAKGYIKDKGGWIYFDDFKDNKTRLVWNKYFENGNKRINVLNENNSNKIIYPYDEMKSFINWFNKNYYKIAEEQGWGIFDSDTEVPTKEYISNDSYRGAFWQIQHYDDLLLNSDTEADELARIKFVNKKRHITKCSTNKGFTTKLKLFSPLVGRCSLIGLCSAIPYLCYTLVHRVQYQCSWF